MEVYASYHLFKCGLFYGRKLHSLACFLHRCWISPIFPDSLQNCLRKKEIFCVYSYFLLFIRICFLFFEFQRGQIWPKGRAVLITGCDSGFGHLLAERLHAMEFTVFACCLKNEETSDVALGLLKIGTNTGRMHVIQMDVTSQKDVDRARQIVEAHLPTKGLWGVVNNANRYRIGFLEWTSSEAYETVLLLYNTVYS